MPTDMVPPRATAMRHPHRVPAIRLTGPRRPVAGRPGAPRGGHRAWRGGSALRRPGWRQRKLCAKATARPPVAGLISKTKAEGEWCDVQARRIAVWRDTRTGDALSEGGTG